MNDMSIKADPVLPLSTAQRGMWVGQQLAPRGAVFNIAEAIELHGVIDPDLLRQALRQVTAEMDTLRVRIVQQGLMARQAVAGAFADPIALLDFSGGADPRQTADRWMMAELSAPTDFEAGPVWVSAVLKIAQDHWIWYHRAHHIMLDGFSGGMVVRRVAELYSALRQGRAPEPAPFLPLSTLIEAEAAYRTSDRYAKDRAYWMERMAGLPEPVSLARRARPQTGGLLRSTALLPQVTAERLRERLAGSNVSLPQALIALVAAYYHRVSGAEDLVFGMPVTARVGGAMRRCAGMVANAVPIRLAMSADDSFEALFAQTGRAVREALRHQQYRYEDLRRDLGLLNQGKQIARLGINIEPFDYELTFDGVRATPHNLSNAHMEDLTVFVYDRADGEGLRIDLDANPGLYGKAELDAHRDRLARLIEAVSGDTALKIGEVELLDSAERAAVLWGWNDTDHPVPALLVANLVRDRAERAPDAVAVAFEDRPGCTLTYGELLRRGRALAHRLARRGVGPGDLVAVALARSEMLPVALLAVQWTGAAYLPVGMDGTNARTAMILEDAAPALVLAERAHGLSFEALGLPCLFLDETDPPGTPEPLLPRLDPEAPAYVLHTSGSTGRPKGVIVTHANFANFIAGMKTLLRPTTADRLLSVTTPTFDIAGLELFLPLSIGAQVVIAGSETVFDPLALGRLVETCAITLMQATPSLWRMLLANASAPLDAVHALVGGEALSAELAGRMLARAAKLTNLYGPTETTVWSTAMTLEADDIDPPPIGRPIRNTRTYVLDAAMRPVPVGVTGGLYIGGEGVAQGYLNRPDLTAERFTDDPFAPGGRLYRTGDLARWREDGVLEYLGRDDQQLKIRGHRVEPAEIEAALERCEGVAQAAVAARADPAGTAALVAYVTAEEGAALVHDELKRALASRLPIYMLPSLFVTLEAMPQTANGKLDRKALPAPSWEREAVQTLAEPRNPTEQRLLQIWRKVLRRDEIGVFDNFFELGGDSLTGAELFMGITEAFAREIPFASLFRASTIASLAEILDSETADDPLDTMLPLKTQGSKLPLFCVHPVIGFGWSYAALMRHIDPDQPLYALQAPGLRLHADDPAARPQSVEALAQHYLAQIRRVQPHGPYHLLGWSFGGLVAHAIAAQLRGELEEVAFLAMLDSYPFVAGEEAARAAEDEGRQVQMALAFLGLPAVAEPPSTMTALADHLCAQYDLMSQPIVQAVVKTETDIMERLGRVVRDNLVLARRYDPPAIDVDLLFCQATTRSTEALDVLQYQPQAWAGRVRKLAVHDIDCHHQDILSPDSAARIGAIMRSHRLDSAAAAAKGVAA